VPAKTPSQRQGRTQAERRATSERRLLNATARVVADRGTTSVSFAEIARAAGCSHGLPGYLFGSKTDLLLALIADVVERFRDEMVAQSIGDAKGLDAALGMTEAFLSSLKRPFPYTRVVYVMIGEAAGAPPEIKDALNAHHASLRGFVRDVLIEGIDRGEIRPDIDVEAEAAALVGMSRGIGTQALLDPKAIDVRAVTAAAVDIQRRALAVEP